MNMLFRSFLFVLLLIPAQFTFSQDFVTDIESYTVVDGLSQTTINIIFQDSRGFLWVGTQGGLSRYDGYNFKTYSPQLHRKNAISSNFITSIAEDKSGNIWVGTKNGLNKYIFNEDIFITYRNESGNPLSIASDEIQGLMFDKKGNFWIKTSETLDRFDFSSGNFYHYPFYNNIFNFDNERVNYPILEDKTGRLWLGTKDGLNYLDRSLLLFDRYIFNENKSANWSAEITTALLITKKDEMWVGTSSGLFLFDRASRKFSQPAFMKRFKGRKINALLEDAAGIIWIGSDKGIEFFDPNTELFKKFQVPENLKVDALQSQILSFFQDKSGILWVGTNRGLIKVNVHAKKFTLIGKNTEPEMNLTSFDIASIFKEKNILWVGTWGEGLNIIDLADNSVRKFVFSSLIGNANLDYIHSIYKDRKNNYWLGTRDGVLYFNPVTGSAKNICEEFEIEGCLITKSNRISQIIEDNVGNLWFTSYYGLLKLNSSSSEIKSWHYSSEDSLSMPSNINYCIKKDSRGFFWIGTDKGLVKFDPITGKILKKSRIYYQEKFTGDITIYSIEIDEDNKAVWAGSDNGLIRFDLNCNVIEMFNEDEHLSGNVVYSILKDNFNNLWLSTNRGINKFNIQNKSIISYDLTDGLQNYEYNLGAYLKDVDGTFYFGGISGLNIIRPDSVAKNSSVPNVVLTNIEIIDKNGIRKNIRVENDEIVLPYGTNLLTLDFATLDFAFPLKNQYKYKFYSGEEPDWINIGNRRTTTFTNLKPGKFTFRLIGSNSDMVWNENGVQYTIIVQSPFWLTTLAFYLYAVFAALLFFAIYQFRTFQFHKTNKLLKQQEIIAKEMLRQKEELSIKNKNITDSINYAKRIQEALMPSERQIKKAFPNSFVLLKPKDIVSGDFFWISERNDKVFVAAIDCTGHGVPGAFMSIIGYELFRKITNNRLIESASELLTLLNLEFETIFKDVDNFTLRDGMDIAFVIIDKKKKKLEFSGAINPMYLIRNNKIQEIRGSRFSIGIEEDVERDQIFESSQVELQTDDIFYLFSDGYADQFGGPEGKKFKYRRFRHLLLTIHRFPMDEQLQLLEERLESWKGEIEQVDDILVLGIKPSL
jgi:ligand-binding sensor domain-containing protein/serine phosphatase RsbU (regulator of sigma subunit)